MHGNQLSWYMSFLPARAKTVNLTKLILFYSLTISFSAATFHLLGTSNKFSSISSILFLYPFFLYNFVASFFLFLFFYFFLLNSTLISLSH